MLLDMKPDSTSISSSSIKSTSQEANSDTIKQPSPAPRGRKPLWRRVLVGFAWGIGGLLALLVIVIAGATFWLTPERLTEIVNREGSKLMNADVRAQNVRWTFWSSFPRVTLQLDSLYLRSRNFDSISPSLRAELPENADFLLSAGATRGGLNVHDLVAGRIVLHDVETERVNVNLVVATDSLNNYNILQTSESSDVPRFGANSVELKNGGKIDFVSLPDTTRASVRVAGVLAEKFKGRFSENSENSENSEGLGVTNPQGLNKGLGVTNPQGLNSENSEGLGVTNPQGLKNNKREDSEFARNSYRVKVWGDVSANVDSLDVLAGFPFGLDGVVGFAWKPFRVRTSDFGVKLGNTNGLLTLSANLSGDGEIERLQYKLPDFSVNELLRYFPFLGGTIPEGFDGDLRVEATARLTSPLRFSSTALPSGIVEASVLPGEIGYEFEGKNYRLSHSRIEGELVFNGEKPEASSVSVTPFTLATFNGSDRDELLIGAEIENLLGDAVVTARADGSASLGSLTHILPRAGAYDIEGRGEFATTLRFNLADAANGRLDMIKAGGEARLTGLSGREPQSGLKGTLEELKIAFNEQSRELSSTYIGRSLLEFAASASNLRVNGRGLRADLGSLTAKTRLKTEGGDSLQRLLTALPIGLDLEAGKFHVELPRDTMSGHVGDIRMTADLLAHPTKGTAREIRGRVTGRDIDMHGGKSMAELGDMLLTIDLKQLSAPRKMADYKMPTEWTSDAEGRRISSHTPAFLQVEVPAGIRRVLETWRGQLRLQVAEGWGSAPVFPVKTRVNDLDLAVTFDSVELRSLHLDALDTRVKVKGGVTNIRQFLLSRTPAPLNARLDVVMDTIQLNRLCAAYEHGQVVTKGPEAAVLMPKSYYFTPEDTIAMLLPRNIRAAVTASAMESKYTNLYLYDLAAQVLLADGRVEAKDVKARAAFGHLWLDYLFDTSDIDKLEMALDARLWDVDVVQFFSKFHTLSLMIPGSHDFSGNLGISAKAHFNAFPNMYLDFPSIWADVHVAGRDLAIDQPKKYERLTKFLMLTDNSTLNIPVLNAHLSVHDNLMELYPMSLTLGHYDLSLAGLNNFSGGMYYHIGVDKSPLHLPFGINLKGTFSHPKVRFGGAHWKPENAREVENTVSDSLQVNMLLETKYFIREMIHKAAMADSLGNNHYTY